MKSLQPIRLAVMMNVSHEIAMTILNSSLNSYAYFFMSLSFHVTFISVSPERLPPSTRHTMTSAKPRLVSSRLWSHQKIHEQWSGRQPLMFYRVTAAAVTAVAAVTATAVSPEQDPSEHEGDLLRSRPPVSRSYHLLCLSTRDTNTHANTILILFVVVCGSGEPGQIPCKRWHTRAFDAGEIQLLIQAVLPACIQWWKSIVEWLTGALSKIVDLIMLSVVPRHLQQTRYWETWEMVLAELL